MAKKLILLSLLLTLATILLLGMTSCFWDDDTTAEETTAKPEITTTVKTTAKETTKKPPVTTVPVTTEEPLRATEGLVIVSNGDGTAKVTGLNNAEATELVIPEYSDLGDRVIEIAASAFMQNTKLTRVILPKNVYTIGANAFYGCTSLVGITFAEGLEFIQYGAFSDCSALERVHFPATLTEVAPTAFSGCRALKLITVAEGGKTFRYEGNCLIRKKDDTVVLGCSGSKIPKSAKAIADQAFYNMGITEILMPNGIVSIGKQAFGMNETLTALVLSESLETLSDLAFYRCAALESVYLPKTLTAIGLAPFRGCTALTRLTIAQDNPAYRVESLCLIEKGTDRLVQGLKDSTVPASVKVIGKGAFSMIPVEALTLPDGCLTVEAEAFANTYALRELSLPATLAEVHKTAFNHASALQNIHYEGNEAAFNALMEGITLPEKVTVTFGEESVVGE